MTEIEECERHLQECQAKEQVAFVAAVDALKAAANAKTMALHAWIYLARARGSTDEFKQTYREIGHLWAIENRKCESIVRSALHVGRLARLGLW